MTRDERASYVYFRGSYYDCLYEASQRPGIKIIPASERDFSEQLYRLLHTEYDDEYRQMIKDNRTVDRELRRRQKVRRKRGRGQPLKKKQVWVYNGGRVQRDKSAPEA